MVVLTISTSVIIYQQNISIAEKNIRSHIEKQVKLDITRLQNILYNYLSEHSIADAQLNVSVTAMNPSMEVLVLVDENNKVIAANRYIWIDNLAPDVIDYDAEVANLVKSNNKPEIIYDKYQDYLISGYYPVILQQVSGTTDSNKTGILFTKVDIKRELLAAKNTALNQSLAISGSMLLIALLVLYLLHKKISLRLNKLALASENIANGNYSERVDVAGNDEITNLAKSFNKMGKHIRIAIESRDETKNNLLVLNENLEAIIDERTKLLKEAQHIAQMGNWSWDIRKNKIFWSDEVFTIYGQNPDTFTPALESFFSTVHPDDKKKVEDAIEASLVTGERYKVEHRFIRPDGSIRWAREEGIPLFDNEGNRTGMNGVVHDITEAKAALEEKEKLEHEMQQMQKMESLGQLTGGIAHDFNNMLAIISGYTELSKEIAHKYGDKNLINNLEQIETSASRSTSLVKKMLAFSRISENLTIDDTISVSIMLKEVSDMLKPILSSSIKLNIIEDKEDYMITADHVMLDQILMNLCVNAKDAMKNGQGQIDIEVKKVRISNISCASCFKNIDDEFVQIAVSDNGSGMPEELMNRIFEPFYTTKEVGKGTGMGLSMVHGLMHKYGGHLLLNSKEGSGSTFKLLFQEAQINKYETESVNNQSNIESENSSKGNILVVDDEAAIADFLKTYLELQGFNVDVVHDSQEALEHFNQHKENINLVITDFTMPGLNGMQLAEKMLLDVPDLSILLCSGYSEHFDEAKAKEMNIKHYLTKPIDTKQLLSVINQHIN